MLAPEAPAATLRGAQPAGDLALLADAARAAGAIALRHWKKSPKTWDKPDGTGPVTEADLAVNAALEAKLRRARPDYGWLSEESPEDPARHTAAAVFVVDPIDGTRSFIAGEDSFAVSLAVVRSGHAVAGAVFLPALDRLYLAEAGGAALLNGAALRASEVADPEAAQVLTTRPNLDPRHWPGGLPGFRRGFRPSLAYRLCLVAEGRFDAMLTFGDAWEWDIAAGALIAEQAGARVSDRRGATLRFNNTHPQTPGVLAAPGALHAALMARIVPPV